MEKFQTKKGVPVCVNFYTFMFHFKLLFPHGSFVLSVVLQLHYLNIIDIFL